MNHYFTSQGDRVTQSQIDYRIRRAKEQKLNDFLVDHGYYHCEQCGLSNGRLDCSHGLSVQKAKDEGRSEECWNVDNLTLLCRNCHQRRDKLNLQNTIKNV